MNPLLPAIDRTYAVYLFDLDGTIWLTNNLLPGAVETISILRGRGCRTVFLTNNSDGTRAMFARQLSDRGIPAAPEEIVSSAYVMARYLRQKDPGSRCYVIGADPMREELYDAGLRLSDRPGEIDYVVLGIDRDFTYHKLQTAFEAIRAGARFVATNPDPYSPSARGDLADIGAEIAAIETATSHKLDQLVGKPDPYIIEAAIEAVSLPGADRISNADILMVGDQLGTDVLAAQRCALKVALLLRDGRVIAQLNDWPTPPDYGIQTLLDLIVHE